MTVVAEVWTQHRDDLADLRAVIAKVPQAPLSPSPTCLRKKPGLLGRRPSRPPPVERLRADYHLPALLLIEREAFWPMLFANPAQQPIQLRPEYARLAREAHDIPPHADLVTIRIVRFPRCATSTSC